MALSDLRMAAKESRKLGQQLSPGSCGGGGPALVAAVGRVLTVQLGGEGKIRTGDVLDLFGEVRTSAGPNCAFRS